MRGENQEDIVGILANILLIISGIMLVQGKIDR